jgi:hypothetical protein
MNDLNPVSQLLTTCDSLGIRLLPDVDGGLSIDAPQDALTPELLQQLVVAKVDLLAHLAAEQLQTETPTSATAAAIAVCRCGSTTWQDVPIHDGRSTRRDCARCARFVDFSRWYDAVALQDAERAGRVTNEDALTKGL